MLMDVAPGQVLGRYELLMPIARGGMAMVWAARLKGSRGFQKLVAIKTMLPAMSDDPNFEKMFLDEASLASEIRHPHVIEILDLGEQDNVLYLVMEWVDGEPLNVLMNHAAKQGGIPLRIAVSLVAQACRGLHAAHELRDEQGTLVGLVHRDITPQNILVSYDGVVKIVDFGVAKATSRIAAETEAGQLKGKIAYMSPEQLRGNTIDRRTDVFALGILLYMLTTGVHPFKGDDQPRTIDNILSDEPIPSPRRFVPGISADYEAVLAQALAKDPGKRFPSANDLLKALTRVMQPATDEEVADYVRNLLQDLLEKRRRAVKAALEIADEREQGGTPTASQPARPLPQDDVATAVHRGVMPSAPELDSRPRVTLEPGTHLRPPRTGFEPELSLSGIGGPSYSSMSGRGSRRVPLWAVGAVVGALGALGLAFLSLSGAPADGRAEPAPLRAAAQPAPQVEPQQDEPAGDEAKVPEPNAAPSAGPGAEAVDEAQKAPAPRAPTRSAPKTSTKGAASEATPRNVKRTSEKPFVTPVRDPGF